MCIDARFDEHGSLTYGELVLPGVSDREILQRKDFAQMTAAEIAAAKDAIRRMVLPLNEVRTRRLKPHRHGHVMDMRRTLRASMKAGGALIGAGAVASRSRCQRRPAPVDGHRRQ